ncbi:hypothetical protein [Amycolatopsis suaedae]|uniref:Uncharacterized protein n=1 Tax=Amycolatopsis suaedae TaxID=2510978 RepID=A0A4Q7J9G2_9PSEU|nr:hypothetical protein [Amycolatopsis suaedae]RZQ63532.1 hypothetical protein EWH70_13995 [Amycolatopsis suaedae]
MNYAQPPPARSQGGGIFGLLQIVSWACALAVTGLGVTGVISTVMIVLLLIGSIIAIVGRYDVAQPVGRPLR